MNVLISVDEHYLKYTGEFLYSLYRNTNEQIDVYLMNIELAASKIEVLRNSLHKYPITIHDIKVNLADKLPPTPEKYQFTIETYFRCFAQFIMPESMDRILYLDVDLVVNHSICEFYHQDFEDNYYVACQDRDDFQNKLGFYKKSIGVGEHVVYFNAGVLLVNLEKLRNETCQTDILKNLIDHYQNFEYCDQDLLNYLYHEKVKIEDWHIYNFQSTDVAECSIEQLEKASIIHYIGKRKPWGWLEVKNKQEKYYWKNRISFRKQDIFIGKLYGLSHYLCYIVREIRQRQK